MASPPEKRRSEEENSRDWSGLPAPALFSIAMSLTGSLADVLTFGRVCRAWRSVARDNERDLMSSLPPFLFLRRNTALYCPTDGRMYKNRRLTELVGEELDVGTLRSFGHLFVAQHRRRTFSVVNPLALTRAHAGKFPPGLYVWWAVLSSSPASPDCVLWYFDVQHHANIRRLRLRDRHHCTKLSSRRAVIDPPVFFRGKAYFLDYEAEFSDGPFVSSPEVAILPALGDSLRQHLCVCGAELLLVTSATTEYYVHRFDFSSSVAGGWVRVHSLGGRALLWDVLGVTVSESPGRWGGRGDCIYFVSTTGDCVVHCVFDLKDGTRTEYCRRLQINPSPDTMLSLRTAVWILQACVIEGIS